MKNKPVINTLIIDDEPSARTVLKIMINNFIGNCTIIGEADSVADAIEKINEFKPNLLLLDIELPDGNGFDIIDSLGHNVIPTIFITAFDHYAIKAIKHNAFDYLLKPVDQEELFIALQNVNSELFQKSLNNYRFNQSVSSPIKQKLALLDKGNQVFISFSDILFCLAEKSYTTIHLISNKTMMSSKNLGEFEKILPNENHSNDFFFYRIHHGSIINLTLIDRYDSKSGIVKLITGKELKVSERRKPSFHKRLKAMSDHM